MNETKSEEINLMVVKILLHFIKPPSYTDRDFETAKQKDPSDTSEIRRDSMALGLIWFSRSSHFTCRWSDDGSAFTVTVIVG